MVSGIGPKDTLGQQGIPVLVDRPGVGQNMWDNPMFAVSYAVNLQTVSSYINNPDLMATAIEDYNQHRTNYLTSSGADVISFEKISTLRSSNFSSSMRKDLADAFPDDWPEIEFWSENAWVGPELGSPAPDTTKNYASMAMGLIAPMSRGWVSIKSSSMSSPPVINPNWLTHPADQAMAVAAVQRARQYFHTPAMESVVIGEEAFPGPNVATDSEILAVLRRQLTTFYHAAATCKMGRRSDHMSVVDSEARVIGTENLRVVDISAFPFLPPGQPQATVYMLAEKIAESVLSE